MKIIYDCPNIDNYKLAVYGAVYLYHKEDSYNLKELLNSTTEENYKERLNEITSDSKCDLDRFFPKCKEMLVVIKNLPMSVKDDIGINNDIRIKNIVDDAKLSSLKCIILPKYYAFNMLILSTNLKGGTKTGAILGLVNPINTISNVFLAPIYLLGKWLSPAINDMINLNF